MGMGKNETTTNSVVLCIRIDQKCMGVQYGCTVKLRVTEINTANLDILTGCHKNVQTQIINRCMTNFTI
jgi:hypothetical protein